ncbi:MAG: iron-containing alcohol dehydrogenase [Firmicutes bacterium]|nr:iron-containing alcohol dehydrogenase [Bacillota bacterium]
MNNFRYNVVTDVRFGKRSILQLKEVVELYGGKNILIVYGGGSIKKNGIYDDVVSVLKDCNVCELSGIEPNPDISKVREGAKICKEKNIDCIVAVGGGSVIDTAKCIGAGAYYDSDPWDLVEDGSKIGKVLPIIAVLTISATGSEMNKNAVISDKTRNIKLGTSSLDFIPKAAICDPEYLYSLPSIQTAAGTADIMSHIFEQYFRKDTGATVSDHIAEALLKTCIEYCKVAIDEPKNYEARANLMWASSLALNSLISCGKEGAWSCHPIEHEMSAYYDITHGIGLAIITPRWMRYILNDSNVSKFAQYGRNVWDIRESDDKKCAESAIDKTENFFKECGIPMTMKEVNIDSSKYEIMAEAAVRNNSLDKAFVPLNKEDIVNIFRMCE